MVESTTATLLVVLAALATVLVITALRHRRTDGGNRESERVDRYLRRTDLIDEGVAPENPIEWLIKLAASPWVQFGLVGLALLVGVLAVIAGAESVAVVTLYFTALGLLIFGTFYLWDLVEARLGGDESTEEVDGIPVARLPAHVRRRLKRDRR